MIPDRLNEHYASEDDLLAAIAEAMRVEYRAIIDAGLFLQLDDARIAVTYDRMVPPATLDEYRRWVGRQVEVINHALEGIPEDRVRYHVCWGIWPYVPMNVSILFIKRFASCPEWTNEDVAGSIVIISANTPPPGCGLAHPCRQGARMI